MSYRGKEDLLLDQRLRDLGEIAKRLPQTKLISVMDREADIYEVFEEQLQHRLDLVVRAQHNRRTTEMDEQMSIKLFDLVSAEPSAGQLDIVLNHQSARPKKSKVKARLPITIIHVHEEAPPDSVEAMEWFILTSLPIENVDAAVAVIGYYCKRWRIEDWHRVLKSGCHVEDHTHRTAERLRRAIAVDLVIGWRIMLMTLLGRGCGDLPADVMFSDIEIRVLRAWCKDRGIEPFQDLAGAVRIVARMGGYLGRKSDPPPGHQLIWEGLRNLCMLCIGFALRE